MSQNNAVKLLGRRQKCKRETSDQDNSNQEWNKYNPFPLHQFRHYKSILEKKLNRKSLQLLDKQSAGDE